MGKNQKIVLRISAIAFVLDWTRAKCNTLDGFHTGLQGGGVVEGVIGGDLHGQAEALWPCFL
jgi:hypothetical protein